MAIALVNTSTNNNDWGTSVVLDKPTNTAEGHALLAIIMIDKEAESINSVPSGWSAFTDFPMALGSKGHVGVYHKVAGASEPSTYTWGISGTSSVVGAIAAFSGTDTSDPFGNEGYTYHSDYNTDVDGPSITIQTSDNVAVHLSGVDVIKTFAPPGGTPTYTEIVDYSTGFPSVSISWATYTSTGATGIKSATISSGQPRIGVHIELLIAAAGTAYTLDAAAGSYPKTGTAASLLKYSKVAAAGGSYALTGTQASTIFDRILAAAGGSLALTGSVASLLKGSVLSAAGGSYALDGQAAGLTFDRILAAAAGAYALTGSDATLTHVQDAVLSAEAGTFLLSGSAAALKYDRIMPAAAGAYALTGADATLTYAQGATLFCDAGTFLLTGSAAALKYDRILLAAAGTLTLTGTAATLLLARLLAAGGGSLALTGTAVDFLIGYLAAAGVGTITLNGQSVTLTYSGETTPQGAAVVAFTIKKPSAAFTIKKPSITLT